MAFLIRGVGVSKAAWAALILLSSAGVALCAEPIDRRAVVNELLKRSRLLDDVRFRVPLNLWKKRVRHTLLGIPDVTPPPVPMIAEEALYEINVGKFPTTTLKATLRLTVFLPYACRNTPAFSAERAWDTVTVNGKAAKLATVDGFLRFSPAMPGEYVLVATSPLIFYDDLKLAVPRTVRTLVALDSDNAYEVRAEDAPGRLLGDAEVGTHGRLAMTPRDKIVVEYRIPTPVRERPPRLALSGPVAWNLDAAGQQVTAALDVRIIGGRTDRIELTLPRGAARVSVTGPHVRETRPRSGGVSVFLRGKIDGQTRLAVNFELPAGRADRKSLAGFGVRDGAWSGGNLVITSTAGGVEVEQVAATGLRELALWQIPLRAAAILPGAPALAYEITGRSFSAEVEAVDLGEFALRESIADLAQHQLLFRADGVILCKTSYEIRNRTRQFLRLSLPAGAKVLAAHVNDKSAPLSPVGGDEYLLPLVRSKASVKGLVSFPVEVVVMYRAERLAKGVGEVEIPLPRIDLPVAYAWALAHVPDEMKVRRWSGPMINVNQYSSETAIAHLGYGSGELAEGHTAEKRIKTPVRPPIVRVTAGPPAADQVRQLPPGTTSPIWASVGAGERPRATSRPAGGSGLSQLPNITKQAPALGNLFQGSLGRNYWRAGRDLYERGEYGGARVALNKAMKLAPGTAEADNAKRLLGNIDLAQGKLALKSKAEKVAGAKVRYGQKAMTGEVVRRQEKLLEGAKQSARAGKYSQARSQIIAAEALSRKLIEQGADSKELSSRMKTLESTSQVLIAAEKGQVRRYYDKLEQGEAAGHYVQAFSTARTLRDTLARQGADADELAKIQKKLTALAVKSAEAEAQRRMQTNVPQRLDFRTGPNVAYRGLPTTMPAETRISHREAIQERRSIQSLRLEALADQLETLEAEQAEVQAESRRHLREKDSKTAFFRAKDDGGFVYGVASRPGERDDGVAAITRLEKFNKIARERNDVSYSQALKRSAQALQAPRSAGDFDRARDEVNYARTLMETSRRRYSPAGYRARKFQIDERLRYIELARSAWEGEEVFEERLELEVEMRVRRGEAVRRKREKVAILEGRVRSLRRDEKYAQAVDVLDAILNMDPGNPRAAEEREELGRWILIKDRKAILETARDEEMKSYNAVTEMQIPWYDQLRYPDDWPALDLRRQDGEANRLTRKSMRSILPQVEFIETPFKDVVDFFRNYGGVSIYVNWGALQGAGLGEKSTVTVRLRNVSLEKALKTALEDLGGGATPLRYVVDEGVITISTKDDLGQKTLTRVYDIRDMIVRVPSFTGPKISLESDDEDDDDDGGSGSVFGDSTPGGSRGATTTETTVTRQQQIDSLLELIQETVERDSWGGDAGSGPGSIKELGGQIIVTQTAENHRRMLDLLSKLREATGPQVQEGTNIAAQRAKGTKFEDEILDGDTEGDGVGNGEFRQFVRKNYKWAGPTGATPLTGATSIGRADGRSALTIAGTFMDAIQVDFLINATQAGAPRGSLTAPRLTLYNGDARFRTVDTGFQNRIGVDLVDYYTALGSKLQGNLGQKIAVNSININVDTPTANALGIGFTAGNNGVNYAVVDEAQLRTLMELEARRPSGANVLANPRMQETIVGTDTLLANGMVANNPFAADVSNSFDINGNTINLPHEKYIVISNGGYLTAMRSAPMQDWRERAHDVRFAEAPQQIDIPAVGRAVKFEKKLVQGKDNLFIRASYVWKGDSR